LAYLAMVIVLLDGAFFLPRLLHPPAPLDAPMPSSAAIEETWGIRITRVALTADNGMVDLRYQVLDPRKAEGLGADPESTPRLVSEAASGVVAQTAPMPHKDTLQIGKTYFLLYHNQSGAIRARSYVTLELGGLRLGHVPVR
jgi:hypothetical protein